MLKWHLYIGRMWVREFTVPMLSISIDLLELSYYNLSLTPKFLQKAMNLFKIEGHGFRLSANFHSGNYPFFTSPKIFLISPNFMNFLVKSIPRTSPIASVTSSL